MQKSIPITLITGYLGSGKTTLLNNILRNNKGYKVAVIVNDIGEVNIDADIIAKDGIVSGKEESLLALDNGCICCTLRTDLIEQINEIIEAKKFDYIVIEASGICEPIPIAQTICAMEDAYDEYKMPKLCYLDSIISVVDAKRMADEFASGQELLNDNPEESITNLIIEQIEFCNTIILNKIDEVSEDELHIVKDVIKTLQPNADIIETNYSKVEVGELLAQKKFDFERIATSAGWYEAIESDEVEEHHHEEEHECHCHHDEECECHHHHEDGEEHECPCHHDHDGEHHCCCGHDHEDGHDHVAEYGINTFVYMRREPMDRKKFFDYISKPWPKKIIRAKGITYFKDEKDMSYMFEQAGSLKDLTPAGPWLACESPDFVEEVLEQNPDLAKDFDPFYGDRMIKIVFIGSNISEKEITKELDEI